MTKHWQGCTGRRFNDEIHAAKYTKLIRWTNVSTFQISYYGLGLVMKQEILYFKTAEPRVRLILIAYKVWFPSSRANVGDRRA